MRSNILKHPPQLIELLFGTCRRQVLGILLLRPDESFYVRELARLTGVSAGALHRELRLLTDGGLLVRSTSGNQVRYQADRRCPIFEELAGILLKTAGLVDVLRGLLAPLAGHISHALIFGSVAAGKAGINSDIDLLVVGSSTLADVVEACLPGQSRLGRQVNPVVMTQDACDTRFKLHDRFMTRVAREPKLFLFGETSEFGKPAENRSTEITSLRPRRSRTIAGSRST